MSSLTETSCSSCIRNIMQHSGTLTRPHQDELPSLRLLSAPPLSAPCLPDRLCRTATRTRVGQPALTLAGVRPGHPPASCRAADAGPEERAAFRRLGAQGLATPGAGLEAA